MSSRVARSTVYLGVGSNLDGPLTRLRSAIVALSREFGALRVGPLYVTEPDSDIRQPDFLNTVVEIDCTLPPLELLAWTQRLEAQAGRICGPVNGPRPLDVDLLLYGNQRLQTEALSLPHPRIGQRAFALLPLVALAPDRPISYSGVTAKEALASLRSELRVTRIPWSRSGTGSE